MSARLLWWLGGGLIALASSVGHAQAPASGTGAAHVIVGPNVRASNNVTSGGRNECWLTVSPTNPDIILGAAQASADNNGSTIGTRRCSTMISRSGGQTWREINLPEQEEGCFDPMTAAAADGRLYVLQTIMGRNMGQDIAGSAARREGTIRVWSTTDEGKTWKGPAEMQCPLAPDHPRLIVDNSSGPHKGRVYVAWNEVSDTLLKQRYHVFLHYSDDGGETFSDPMLLVTDTGGKLVTAEPVVLSDGTLLVTYYQYFWPLSSPKNDKQPVYVLRSTDGAKTFDSPQKIFDVGSSGWRHLRQDFGRAFTLPIFVADLSSARYRDRIYAVWDDVSAGQSNIWLVYSSDKGRTWSQPRRVNDNAPPAPGSPPDYRMTPVVSVNREGVVGVAWYDRREDPSRRCWRYYFSASSDGGETFGTNVPISSAPSCPDKDLAPTVRVWNVAEEIDDTLPTDEQLEKMKLTMERRMLEEEVGVAEAWKVATRDESGGRIRVAFDKGRNVWPGHYTGLDAAPDGSFHALWADRRNKIQQLFSARVEVTSAQESPAPPTELATITDRVQVIGGPAKYDEGKGTASFEVQVRNVSARPIYGPLRLRVAKIGVLGSAPTAVMIEPDGGGPGVGAWWDFGKHLGSRGRLDPKQISEARTLTIKTKAETGLDGVFEFEVVGNIEKGTTPSAAAQGPQGGKP